MGDGRNVLKRVINKLLHACLQFGDPNVELDVISIIFVVMIIEQLVVFSPEFLLDLQKHFDQWLHPLQLDLGKHRELIDCGEHIN